MTDNNALTIGILVQQFKIDIMVPHRAKEAPRTPDGLPFSMPVKIQETQSKKKDRGIRDSTVKLKTRVIHQRQIPGQN